MTFHARKTVVFGAILATLAGCDEAAVTPPGTLVVPEGPCGHAVYALSTNYQATSVAVVGFDGAVLADAIVSSASATTGLSAPLSGDVVAPTMRTRSGDIVLVDRTPAGVLTWLDPTGVKPTRQLAIGPKTNPYDYAEVTADKAYVPRFDVNPNAEGALDRGGDVLVVRSDNPSIVASIDVATPVLAAAPGFTPHPARVVVRGGAALVLAPTYADGFKESGDSVIIRIDAATDTVTDVVALPGLRGCLGLSLSPDETRFAVACSGTFGGGSTPTLDDAGVAILGASTLAIEEVKTGASLGRPPGFSIAWSANDRVLVPVFGSVDQSTRDALLEIPIGAGPSIVLDDVDAFTLGEIRCASDCDACFLASADGVLRFPVDAAGALGAPTTIAAGEAATLSPKYLGVY